MPCVGNPSQQFEREAKAKAEGSDKAVGGGFRSRRHDIVKEVMQNHGLSLIAASKYVKEHKLD